MIMQRAYQTSTERFLFIDPARPSDSSAAGGMVVPATSGAPGALAEVTRSAIQVPVTLPVGRIVAPGTGWS